MTVYTTSGGGIAGSTLNSDNTYVLLEQFKSTAGLSDTQYMDEDIRVALRAASRAVDDLCNRRFYADDDAQQVRYYSPSVGYLCWIDDLVELTSLKTDSQGGTAFSDTWASSDYKLEPLNAAADGEPWTVIRAHPNGSYAFPTGYPGTVKVTGRFGWLDVPSAVVEATTILAGRFLKRTREAPFGAAELLALGGAAVRITGKDADVTALLGPYVRLTVG